MRCGNRLMVVLWGWLLVPGLATAQEAVSEPLRVPVVEAVSLPVVEPVPEPLPESAGFDGLPIDPARPIKIKIESPMEGDVLSSGQLDAFIKLENYATAAGGNRLHVILDNESPRPHVDTRRPLVIKNLKEGGHTLRVYAVRPDGTAIDMPETFAMVHFFVKKKDFQNYADPRKPFITLNFPDGGMVDLDVHGRLCFDYLVRNAELSEGGFQVRYTIQSYTGTVSRPGPFYFANVKPGKQTLIVELVSSSGITALGAFNRVERKFEVRQPLKAAPVIEPKTTIPSEPHGSSAD
jgi:hypothetical protein